MVTSDADPDLDFWASGSGLYGSLDQDPDIWSGIDPDGEFIIFATLLKSIFFLFSSVLRFFGPNYDLKISGLESGL